MAIADNHSAVERREVNASNRFGGFNSYVEHHPRLIAEWHKVSLFTGGTEGFVDMTAEPDRVAAAH